MHKYVVNCINYFSIGVLTTVASFITRYMKFANFYNIVLYSLHRHRWIHYITDDPPTKCPPVERKFHQSHVENLSGSDQEYVPYSTVVKKVHSWRPPQN